ncbi:MAG: DNA mismatch repair endonuclease MutL [Bacteroidaceae bacterium]|nr:DNA mismatch repair endonuclease MutL [Bacteroidaceae bacterium]
MPDIIRLLPDTVANQIAAGEVIQRPSSVVKELVENAVDAGAKQVKIVIEEAGKTLIQVIDDGCGMSVTDARLAFERHATSKIREAHDLFALQTMGFRGEALPSIAAVAQVELRTRTANDELGTCLLIEGGKVRQSQTINTPRGANFSVRNLFFNIPARRKFLKSNLTEMGNILTEFERLALAHPGVAFQLHRDGTLLYDLPITSFKQRITNLFGKRLEKQLVPVEVETDVVKITGFVGTSDSARRKRAQQFFFANNRYMRHPYLARAVQTAYERLIPEGEQIPFFLRLDVDPATVDVNIHPTKTEIKFQDEQTLWQILLAAVREALGKHGGMPMIDFDQENMPDIPLFVPVTEDYAVPASPYIDTNPQYNPFDTISSETATQSPSSVSVLSTSIPDAFHLDTHPSKIVSQDTEQPLLAIPKQEAAVDYLQYHGRFIICSVRSGLMLIDQHRAHIRILYDRYLRSLSDQPIDSQGLLFPQSLVLSPAETTIFSTLYNALQALGFDIRETESGLFSIYGVPAGTEGLEPEHLVRGIVEEAQSGNDTAPEAIRHRLALALARRAAIPVGQELTAAEMSSICAQLFAGTSPNFTPDGLPILLIINEDKVNKFFD